MSEGDAKEEDIKVNFTVLMISDGASWRREALGCWGWRASQKAMVIRPFDLSQIGSKPKWSQTQRL